MCSAASWSRHILRVRLRCDSRFGPVTLQEAGHVLQLRDVVLPVVAVRGEQRQVLQVLPAGVAGVQLVQLPKHNAPRPDLLLCELHPGNGISAEKQTHPEREGGTE